MKISTSLTAALALVALLPLSACGESEEDKLLKDLATEVERQTKVLEDLPDCGEITAPGEKVDAKAVDGEHIPDGAMGVCKYGEKDDVMALFWTFKCTDGRTLVYSKENNAMGYDGDVWQKATEAEIDAENNRCTMG
jgi:hypothetical protein